MSNLILELRQGEMMILNGAPLRFRTKTRIELAAHARFLFGRQIMRPAQADSPARKIYLALQHVYISTGGEQEIGLDQAEALCQVFRAAMTTQDAQQIVDTMLDAARNDRCFTALKLARRLIRHEDAVLGRRVQ